MKRMLVAFLAALLVLSGIPAAAADVDDGIMVKSTFDSVETYAKPQGWTLNDGGNPVYVEETEEGVNKALMLDCRKSEVVMDYALADAPQSMVSSVDIRMDSCGAEFKIFLQKNSAGKFNNFLSFLPDGTIQAFDGRKLGNWQKGQWHHIVVRQNNKTRRCSISVDGRVKLADTLMENTAFGTPSVCRFQAGGAAEATKVYLDNIYVYDAERIKDAAGLPREPYNPARGEKPEPEKQQALEPKVTDTVYLLDNFNQYEVGEEPENWTVQIKDGKGYVDAVPSETDKSFYMLQTNQDPLLDFMITADSTDIVVEAKVRTDDMYAEKGIFTLRDTTGKFVQLFRFMPSGDLMAGKKSLSRYMRKRWYELGAVIHLDTKTVDYYLGGKLVLESEPFDNMGFGTLERIRLRIGRESPNAGMYVDNIRIYAGSALKDPSTLKVTEESDEVLLQKSIYEDDQVAIDKIKGSVALIENHDYAFAGTEKKHLDAPPFVDGGHTMIPVRFVAEGFGGQVDWSEEAKTVTAQVDGKTIRMTLDVPQIEVDGALKTIDAAPVQVHDRTYVPLRALAEQGLGKSVTWYEKGKMAVVGEAAKLDSESLESVYRYVQYTRPTAETFKKNLKSGHPRIFASAEDFERIRQGAQEAPMKGWAEETLRVADSLMDTSKLVYVKPDGLRLLDTSRAMLSRMYNLGMAYQLTGDKKYADRAWVDLEAVGKFRNWNSANHYLDTAEMTAAVAIGYDWMFDCWTQEQKDFMVKSIVKHSLKPGVKCYTGQPGVNAQWVFWDMNWNVVCNGGMAVGALAILDVEPEIAGFILEQGIQGLEYMLPEFSPDGAWKEGPGYWQYTVQYMVYYMAALQSANGTDYGYLKLHNVGKTAYFPVYSSSAQGSFNIGDGGAGLVNASEIFYFADQMNDGNLTRMRLNQMQEYGWRGGAMDLLFYNPDVNSDKVELTLDRYFGATELASFRSSWNDKSATFAAIHGGQNDVTHGQLDSGTFILDMEGIRWGMDLGADDYNLPAYFDMNGPGGGRWKFYRNRGEGQNTVIIDPDVEADQIYNAFTRINRFETKDKGGYAVVDMTPALENGVKSAKRALKLDNNRRRVVLQDEMQLKGGTHNVWWFMHTQAEIEIAEDGKSAILTQNGKKLYVGMECSDENATLTAMEAQPLPKSATVAGQNINAGIRKLALNLPAAKGNVNITMTFQSFIPGVPNENAAFIPIDEWEIPDGELFVPKADTIAADGVELEGFDPDKTGYNLLLEYDEELPEITAEAVGLDVEITQAKDAGEQAYIKISDPADPECVTYYSVAFRIMPKLDNGELQIKSITASDEPQPENNKENAVDGDFGTRWSAQGSQWLQLDLGEVKDVDAVGVAFYQGDARIAYYSIAVSEDGENFTTVAKNNSLGTSVDFEYTSVLKKARYIRIIGNGTSAGDWNSITEVKVFGKSE